MTAAGSARRSWVRVATAPEVRRVAAPPHDGRAADHLREFAPRRDLAARGFVCPTPIKGRDGTVLRRLCGRPAVLISFLEGLWPRTVEPFHCTGVGDALARFHLAGADFPMRRPNDLSLPGWRRLVDATRKIAFWPAARDIACRPRRSATMPWRWAACSVKRGAGGGDAWLHPNGGGLCRGDPDG